MNKGQEFGRPDPEGALAHAREAAAHAQAGDYQQAGSMLEEAIKLDQVGGLNHFAVFRAQLFGQLGKSEPAQAIQAYNDANLRKEDGNCQEAKRLFKKAYELDPHFLWPLNNLAWMLATCEEPSVRNGEKALKYAEHVCKVSKWNCWAFIGTLAAAYAAAGDFEKAQTLQEAALPMVPEANMDDSIQMLECFKNHQVFIDTGTRVAGGLDPGWLKLKEPSQIDAAFIGTVLERFATEVESDETMVNCIFQGRAVHVRLAEGRFSAKNLHLLTVLRTDIDMPDLEKEAICTILNCATGMAKFAVDRELEGSLNGSIVADYCFPLDAGVSPAQIERMMQSFVGIVNELIERLNTSDQE